MHITNSLTQESHEWALLLSVNHFLKDYTNNSLGEKINTQYFEVRSIYTIITYDPVIND